MVGYATTKGERVRRVRLLLLFAAAAIVALVFAAAANAAQYIVVFKPGHSGQGVKAVKAAGGKVLRINKLGIGTVRSSRSDFAARLRASGKVEGVAKNARWQAAEAGDQESVASAQVTPGDAIAGCN